MNEEIINELKKLAATEALYDNGYDYFAFAVEVGTISDAYSYGFGDGQIQLARKILTSLGIEY